MNKTYEAREYPDDLPYLLGDNLRNAWAKADRLTHKHGIVYLVYEVSEKGERYLGEAG